MIVYVTIYLMKLWMKMVRIFSDRIRLEGFRCVRIQHLIPYPYSNTQITYRPGPGGGQAGRPPWPPTRQGPTPSMQTNKACNDF